MSRNTLRNSCSNTRPTYLRRFQSIVPCIESLHKVSCSNASEYLDVIIFEWIFESTKIQFKYGECEDNENEEEEFQRIR